MYLTKFKGLGNHEFLVISQSRIHFLICNYLNHNHAGNGSYVPALLKNQFIAYLSIPTKIELLMNLTNIFM